MDIDKDEDENKPLASTRPTRKRYLYNPYDFDNRFGGLVFIATSDPNPLIYR